MAVVKEGLEDLLRSSSREGVPTFESINDAIAEPVVAACTHRFVVGGFYRVHTARGKDEEPERAGRAVRPARVRVAVHPGPGRTRLAALLIRFYAYGVVARLAQLAAAIEVEQLGEVAEVPALIARFVA